MIFIGYNILFGEWRERADRFRSSFVCGVSEWLIEDERNDIIMFDEDGGSGQKNIDLEGGE